MKEHRSRDTTDGRFVTAEDAAEHPDTTVTETIPEPSPIIAFAVALCESLREQGDLDLISLPSAAAYDELMSAINESRT